MNELNNESRVSEKLEYLRKLNKAIIVSLNHAKTMAIMLVESDFELLKKSMGTTDDTDHQDDDEKIQRIRELNNKAVVCLNQAKSLSLMVVDPTCDFTALDAHTQHDYLCVLNEKVTAAKNVQKGVAMLCG